MPAPHRQTVQGVQPGSRPDIEAWKKRTGNELVQQSEEDKVFKFWLRKTV